MPARTALPATAALTRALAASATCCHPRWPASSALLRWTSSQPRALVLGQEEAARWLAGGSRALPRGPKGKHWDAPMKHLPGAPFRRVWSLLLLGGRRGDKS